tara:strand:+ start:15423 stop:16727 length:1305 start_codon:yes stop_codon:yes gene_type:complete
LTALVPNPDLLIALTAGPARSDELQARLGLSQPAVSRLVTEYAADILVVGRARATRYARRRPLPGLSPDLPVYRVNTDGDAHEMGLLSPIHGGMVFEDREQRRTDIYPGLPWFLDDMRPQGFMGRNFVRRHEALGPPARLADWNDDHALIAIAGRGDDLAGNLIVGEDAFTRWTQTQHGDVIDAADREFRYPRLAEQALAGELPGSSAGGEQPKFTAQVRDLNGIRHVLVKFCGALSTPVGRRWADLIVCEHLALQTVSEAGLPAAESTLVEAGGRLFLEVTRFDRVGARGRLGLISLGAVDDPLIGQRKDWSQTARALVGLRRLSRQNADHIAWLQAFGTCIANSDMHFGNLSLLHDGGRSFGLAPAYDMLPMRYAPAADGAVNTPEWRTPAPPPFAVSQWASARSAATQFWERVAADGRVSPDIRALAQAAN